MLLATRVNCLPVQSGRAGSRLQSITLDFRAMVSSYGFSTALTVCFIATAQGVVKEYPTRSGIRTWVDPDTPADRQLYTSSRGRRWELTMSDEFNTPKRDFRPGKDHVWTSLEKPDGVNGAKEIYSHNMTSTACDEDGTCYFYIKTVEDHQVIRVYNLYINPPGYEKVEFFYRAAMVQSWNKFCFQGGMLEVRAQLPGAISNKSGNPDLAKGPNGRASTIAYYPTWPGIWMMGNLGRAIFSGSTSRIWPFSYNRCEPEVFDPKNQRISACDSNPGYGMHPNQGRGAPEIDLLEGGGSEISSSLQIGPGMPPDFRLMGVDTSVDPSWCLYSSDCKTPGANHPDVPTALYSKRGHKSWYQGLRYASNPFCLSDSKLKQDYSTVARAVKSGVKENACTVDTCPGSRDVNADLGLIDGNGTQHWGVNHNGTCFPVMNAYTGAYLCDPDNQNKLCIAPRPDSTPKTNAMPEFNYQMDAISSNWPIHVGAYTDYLVYQLEWVTGKNGYVRWMLDGHPIFEITSEAFEVVPQNSKKTNPQKIMLEEPMYLIMNVAMSASWGAKPPNSDTVCRGNGKDPVANRICDELPMYMKVDYVRIYQDLGDDLDADNYMQIGCDPQTHPTKEWIEGHIDSYEDYDNLWVEVAGGAMCTQDDDCTVQPTGRLQYVRLTTGKCKSGRCVCTNPKSWGGPRCTIAISEQQTAKGKGFGPPLELAVGVVVVVVIVTILSAWKGQGSYIKKSDAMPVYQSAVTRKTQTKSGSESGASEGPPANAGDFTLYSKNFV